MYVARYMVRGATHSNGTGATSEVKIVVTDRSRLEGTNAKETQNSLIRLVSISGRSSLPRISVVAGRGAREVRQTTTAQAKVRVERSKYPPSHTTDWDSRVRTGSIRNG